MKRHSAWLAISLCLLFVASAFAVAGSGEEGKALAIGAKAPMTDVKMKNIDGRELSIADVAGKKGTMVIFSCNSCPWVQAWEDRIAEIGNSYQEKGVGVIVINPNDPDVKSEDSYEVMKERAKKRGFKFPYVVDATSDVARAYGATHTPEVFLLDTDNKLVYHGAIDDNARHPDKVEKPYLKDALNALISGEEIQVRESKALGCTIKFRKET
jgi:peroxiredoxin